VGGGGPASPPPPLRAEHAGPPPASWSDAPFRRDAATCLELSSCRQRYHCALSRTVYLGKPPGDMQRVAAATAEGMAAALATVRPGALCQAVELAWRQTINRAGFSKPSHIGYSTGENYPPNRADHTTRP